MRSLHTFSHGVGYFTDGRRRPGFMGMPRSNLRGRVPCDCTFCGSPARSKEADICRHSGRCLPRFSMPTGPGPNPTPSGSTSPSRGRWSTAPSTSTAARLPGKYTHAAALAQGARARGRTARTAFVWIGLHEPDEHQMQAVAEVFGLHELAVEDAVHAHQRPKLERYDDTLFLVLKTVNYVEHESVAQAREIVETGEIMIFVGPRLRGHGAPRRPQRAGRGAQADGRRAPAAGARPVRGDARDRRPRRRQLSRRHRSDRDRHRRHGGGHLLPDDQDRHRARSTCSSGRSSNCAGRSPR